MNMFMQQQSDAAAAPAGNGPFSASQEQARAVPASSLSITALLPLQTLPKVAATEVHAQPAASAAQLPLQPPVAPLATKRQAVSAQAAGHELITGSVVSSPFAATAAPVYVAQVGDANAQCCQFTLNWPCLSVACLVACHGDHRALDDQDAVTRWINNEQLTLLQ